MLIYGLPLLGSPRGPCRRTLCMARTRAPHLVDVPFVAAGSGHGPLFSYPLRILVIGGGPDPFSQVPLLMHPFVCCLGFSCNRFASSGLEMLEGCVAKLDTRAALYKGCVCNDQIITRRYNDRGAVLAQGARFPAGKATARGRQGRIYERRRAERVKLS